jgi:Family of unknown function (DUF6399)
MTPCFSTEATPRRTDSPRWKRADAAAAFDHFARQPSSSQRDYAHAHGIPRSTLGDWLRQPPPDGLDPQLVAFLRSAAGEQFLRLLVLSLFLVFHLQGGCGLRLLQDFLRRTGLDRFVAASYGALHTLGLCLEERLAAFARAERASLAQGMSSRPIALIADENFHGPDPCLVALEPASGFIVVEEYQPQRDAPTWAAAIRRGLNGLEVEVVLLTSDEARGLVACAGQQLRVQHLPELFHGLRHLARPFGTALRRQIASAEKQLRQAQERLGYWQEAQKEADQATGRRGRRPDYSWQLEVAAGLVKCAAQDVQAGQTHREAARQAVRGLADDYHPFDPQTGEPLLPEQAEKRLGQRLSALEELATAADLGGKAQEALAAGRNWLVALVAGLSWFWAVARQRVQALQLSPEAEQQVYAKVLSGLYWQGAARRARTPAGRRDKRRLGEQLEKEGWSAAALARLPEWQRREIQRVGREVVNLFQRSSSCVEGRNGRLSLFQHGHTRLSDRKLQALTAVHNYVRQDADGTTAAERFFGKKPRDVMAWLLEEMPDLPRPAAKRPKKAPAQSALAA